MARWSPSDPHTDRRLVEGLREGNATALTTLYDTYAERLYDYCSSVVGEPAVAADIVHDVMIDACGRAPRLRAPARLRPWLYGAARRRCLQRGRGGGPRWYWPAEPPDAPSGELTEARAGEIGSALPRAELRDLLDATLARLDFGDQEVLLFASRHDLTVSDLAAVLGLSGRRAASRLAQARSRALVALTAERQAFARRCDEADQRSTRAREVAQAAAELAGHAARETLESADTTLAAHIAACPACRRRGQVTMATLLGGAPALTVPESLRRRVLHTGTDPELADYRADIAGRGGSLTSDGLPRQPDVPASSTRRWAFLGGGTVGALATVLVAAVIIGPVMGRSDLYWAFRPRLEPSTAQPPGIPATPPPAFGRNPPPAAGRPQPTYGVAPPAPAPSPSVGRLEIGSTSIRFRAGDRVAYLDLSASLAPVTWNAAVSTTRITMSEHKGTIPAGGHTRLAVVLDRAQVEFPGEATITFTSAVDRRQSITVSWAGSLLT